MRLLLTIIILFANIWTKKTLVLNSHQISTVLKLPICLNYWIYFILAYVSVLNSISRFGYGSCLQ